MFYWIYLRFEVFLMSLPFCFYFLVFYAAKLLLISKFSKKIQKFSFLLPKVLSFTTFSLACTQRGGGLGQAGGTIQFMRGTNVHIRTTRSAELHPRLRQTARCVAVICPSIVEKQSFFQQHFLKMYDWG